MAKYVAKGCKLITPTSQVLNQHITMTKFILHVCNLHTQYLNIYNNATKGCQNL
jgi:hypothetical protein